MGTDQKRSRGWVMHPVGLVGPIGGPSRLGCGLVLVVEMIDWLRADGARVLGATANSEGGARTLARLGFAQDPDFGTCLRLGEIDH